MNTTKTILVGAIALAFSCGGAQDPAAEDLTAAEHLAEAEREEARAAEAESRYDPDARERSGSEGLGPVTVGGRAYNPTEHELAAAERHREHADAHRSRAAAFLRLVPSRRAPRGRSPGRFLGSGRFRGGASRRSRAAPPGCYQRWRGASGAGADSVMSVGFSSSAIFDQFCLWIAGSWSCQLSALAQL